MSSPAEEFIAGENAGRQIIERIRGDIEHPDGLYEALQRAFAHGPGAYVRGLVRAVQKALEHGGRDG